MLQLLPSCTKQANFRVSLMATMTKLKPLKELVSFTEQPILNDAKLWLYANQHWLGFSVIIQPSCIGCNKYSKLQAMCNNDPSPLLCVCSPTSNTRKQWTTNIQCQFKEMFSSANEHYVLLLLWMVKTSTDQWDYLWRLHFTLSSTCIELF